jgi:amino acid adenylation domain-containing protein
MHHPITILYDPVHPKRRGVESIGSMLNEINGESLIKGQGVIAETASAYIRGIDQQIAIVDSDREITYGDLRDRVACLAATIRQMFHGIENPVVAIAMPQGMDFVIALLGSLESGCFVVPLDTAIPPKRMEEILVKTAPDLVIAGTRTQLELQSFKHCWNVRILNEVCSENNKAFFGTPVSSWKGIVLYTSGSTGEPKGVLMSGKMLIREAKTLIDRLGIVKEDRISNLLSPSVIGGLREIFTGLLSGATLYPVRVKELGLQGLIDQLHRHEITICRMVSSLFRSLCHALTPDHQLNFRRLYIGGEPLIASDVALFRKHFSPECQLSNVFGATEFGLVTHYTLPADFEEMKLETVPIGAANDGYQLIVVDDDGSEVSQGTPGNLVVAGECIAEGYWTGANDPIDRFRSLPNRPGWRVFNTSDLVRLDSSGQFEYLGRSDTQTKIAGNRVELMQVENILRGAKDVRDAAVISLDFEGSKGLYALVERDKGTTEDLVLLCKVHLPDPAVPRHIIECSAIPRSFQGKRDRRAVVRHVQEFLEQSSISRHCDSSSDVELVDRGETLKIIWRQANRLPKDAIVDPNSVFNADSLSSLDFLINIRNHLNIELSPQELKDIGTFSCLDEMVNSPNRRQISTTQTHCIRLSESKPGPALFLLHGATGEVAIYGDLVDALRPEITVYGVNADRDFLSKQKNLDFSLIVRSAVQSIQNQQPAGPYLLAGYCFGGNLAHEVASELIRRESQVAFCGLIDSFLPQRIRYPKSWRRYLSILTNFPIWFFDALLNRQISSNWRRYKRQVSNPLARLGDLLFLDDSYKEIVQAMLLACDNHVPVDSGIPIRMYLSKVRPLLHSHSIERQWKKATGGNFRCTTVPGNHSTLMHPPYITALADVLRDDIAEVLRIEKSRA